MAHSIGKQVHDEPLDQHGVSVELRRFRRFVDADLESRDFEPETSEGLLHHKSEVDRLTFTQTTFTAGEGEQGIDQLGLLIVGRQYLFCGGAPVGVARVRILERNLKKIAFRCERRA